jgi:hypothetical protein
MPTKELSTGLQRVPNSATDISTTDSWVCQIVFTNITASAVTFTVKDKATTPKYLIGSASAGVTVAVGTTYLFTAPYCVKMTGGVTWLSDTLNGIDAEIFGFKK